MNDPIAFFITIATYGTWLPGDKRGWVEYRQGWKFPDPILELESHAKMTENAKILTPVQRKLVEVQIQETCEIRKWIYYAVNCRTNHLHAVIGAYQTKPRKVRSDLKAWCTRRLKSSELPESSTKWWAERGSIRWVFDESSLQRVCTYTLDGQ